MSVQQLPFDVYVHILQQIPASAFSDDGPKTLIACSQTNTTLRVAASLPSVWEPHYLAKYTICDPARENLRREILGNDWKARFLCRLRIDRQAIGALDLIVSERSGRAELARQVALTMSYDVWNALEAEARRALPEPLELDEQDDEDMEPFSGIQDHALPRRYWAQSLLGTISRSHAMKVWGDIKSGQGNQPESLELAIACLSSFFAYPPAEITRKLEVLAQECRAYLIRNCISVDPDEFNRSKERLERISVAICQFMWEKGFRPVEHIYFYSFNTRFPHWFLSTHKDTIPISLVYIYVCIARRLNISATPLDFPLRVLAVVSSPDPKVPNIFLDVYASQTQPLLSTQQDIPYRLIAAELPPEPIAQYIQPASTESMVLRAAGNILRSSSILPHAVSTVRDLHAALYSALAVNVVFMNDEQVFMAFIHHINQFPLDPLVVLQDVLPPILDQPIRAQLVKRCDEFRRIGEAEAGSVFFRSSLIAPPKYFVGLVFQHAKYDYIGYVYGWDPTCDASNEWIASMAVDSLSHGRNQPFYYAFANTGSTRYVAEENIVPITVSRDAYLQLFEEVPDAGRYFEGLLRRGDRARLVPSPELLSKYPEDNTVANEWIMGGALR